MATIKRSKTGSQSLNTLVDAATTKEEFRAQLALLEHRAARSTNPCLAAEVIALHDKRVQSLLLKRREQNVVFGGMRCVRPAHVLFDLHCAPGTICLQSPAFVAVVDLAGERVVQILDHYEEGPTRSEFSALAIASEGGPTAHEVTASLSGTYQHGEIAVENVTIALSNGTGHSSITLVPPNVEVQLLMWAPAPAAYKFSVTINGRTKGDDDTFNAGKISPSFSYPFSDFGLS